MIGIIILIVGITYFVVSTFKNAYKRLENFPPGPPSLPVYGAYWIVLLTEINNLAGAFKRLSRRYNTKIVGLYLGQFPTIVVNDAAMIKEMLFTEEFDGRLDIILGRLRSYWKKLGIFFTDGYFWHVQRRFSLRYLRDFGFGRRDEALETVVEGEIREMIDMTINGPKYPAEKELVKGDLIYLPHYFAVPFINSMLHVYTKMTLPRSEYQTLWELAKHTLIFQRGSNDLGAALSLTPWLKDLLPNYSGFNDLRKGNQYLLDFFTKLIREVIETYEDTHDRHFLDMYVRRMKEERQKEERTTFSGVAKWSHIKNFFELDKQNNNFVFAPALTKDHLNPNAKQKMRVKLAAQVLSHTVAAGIYAKVSDEDQLALICTDYMFPAATAVESVITMLLERMLLQPEIQDRIHEEIDRVVGKGRLPNLDDRKNLPYTEACLREMMRFETPVPLGVPHRSTSHVKFHGYDIPENTVVSANYLMLHMDNDIWGDPENFRPERFIRDGQLDVAKDKSLPFGAGRRLCAGETYARQSMFQVFAGFMQAFHISTADNQPLRKPSKRIQGIITTIPEFWIRVTPRI